MMNTKIEIYEKAKGTLCKVVDPTIKLYGIDSFVVKTHEVAGGMLLAHNTEDGRKGVVSGNIFYPVVPLNGWRGRELAETVFGESDANLWTIGKEAVTTADVLQNLPGFDGYNQAIVDSYTGDVLVQVVEVDPTYGQYIRIIEL